MAKSDIVTPEALDILEGDIQAKGSVSEAMLRKFSSLLNYVKLYAGTDLGDIKTSFLPLVDFQALHTSAWVSINGDDITNTDYGQLLINRGLASGTVLLPDARGMELVQVNDGRNDGHQNSVNLSAGQFQDQRIQSHDHYVASSSTGSYNNANESIGRLGLNTQSTEHRDYNLETTPDPANFGKSSPTGSSQTNSKRIAVYRYIKVWNVAPGL